MLLCTPSLQELLLADDNMHFEDTVPGDLGKIFLDLRHPASSGLKKLQLEYVCLSADHGETNSLNVAPVLPVNTSLSILVLQSPRFLAPGAVRVLWNVVGLKEVMINSPYHHARDEDESYLEDWAEFIRRSDR